jgi:hypothetical protein
LEFLAGLGAAIPERRIEAIALGGRMAGGFLVVIVAKSVDEMSAAPTDKATQMGVFIGGQPGFQKLHGCVGSANGLVKFADLDFADQLLNAIRQGH